MSDIAGFLYCVLLALICALIIALVIYTSKGMYADMKCAEQGYPKAKVTIDFTAYCMNLDGSVTVKMEKLP